MPEREIDEIKKKIDFLQKEITTLSLRVSQLSEKNQPNAESEDPKSRLTTSETFPSTLSHGAEKSESPSPELTKSKTSFSFISWIGENIFIKLGVLSLAIVSIWFLNYAFEEYWINESMRIWIGIITGFIVFGIGFWTRTKHPYIATSLLGLGIMIGFSAYFIGFQFYDLYSLEFTFVGLFLLCILAVTISLVLDSEFLFGFSNLGAFFVPILLSSGQNSYLFLFTYLLFWDFIFVYFCRRKHWQYLPLLLILGNHLVFIGWAYENLESSPGLFPLIFQLVLYILFLFREFHFLPKAKNQILSLITLGLVLSFGFIQSIWVASIYFPTFKAAYVLFMVIIFYGFYHRLLQGEKNLPIQKEIYDILGLFGLPFVVSAIVFGMEGRILAFGLISFSFLITIAAARSKQVYLYYAGIPVWFFSLIHLLSFSYRIYGEMFLMNGRIFLFLLTTTYLLLCAKFSEGFYKKLFQFTAYPYLLLGTFIEIYLHFPPEKRLFLYSVVLLSYGLFGIGLGFYKHIQSLKLVGIFSLGLVVLKFYLYDFWNLSIGFRIIAGLILGISLIGTGILYNRQKKETI
ncbi:DUF2339 domain-containing protein [Leptospira sp. 96542]|nr:DUF2339 domain-containing protein [Leptospira sp. 96542]